MSPAPVLPDEVGMRQRREVNLRHRVIEEERLLVADAALHERDALLGRLAIDGAARLQIERLDVARRRSGPALPDERRIRRGLALRDRRLRLVAGARDAVVLVEALLRRVPILRAVAAEMPLAEQARGVADRLQRFRDRHFPQRDAGGLRRAGPDGVASGHQRRARDRAGELDVEVVEPEPFGRQAIQARRDRAAHAAIDVRPRPIPGCRETSGRCWAGRPEWPARSRRRAPQATGRGTRRRRSRTPVAIAARSRSPEVCS